MVAENPLFSKWSLKKFKATVINDIWPEVLFFAAVATSTCISALWDWTTDEPWMQWSRSSRR